MLAANPCPCGNYRAAAGRDGCTCSDQQRRRYQARVRGPVLDRVDITRHLAASSVTGAAAIDVSESTAAVRARVSAARDRQAIRFTGESWRLNGQVPGPALRERWPLLPDGAVLLDQLLVDGRLTQRGAVRSHRLAWTIADLAGTEAPGRAETEVALKLRSGDPLMAAWLERRAG